MPVFTDDMDVKQIAGSNYSFSAAKIETLGSTEYTLVTLVVDVSGSVSPFANDIENMVKTVVEACRIGKHADNLLLRVLYFNTHLDEVHGFQMLPNCTDNVYNGTVRAVGGTALYDATYNAAKAMADYGRELTSQDYTVNAILFVITDGDDNSSKVSTRMVKEAITEAQTKEAVESILSILIGVNVDSSLNNYLQTFKNEVKFDQYEALAKANARGLSKLANFISTSVSSQSQSRGTGGPSKTLTF